MLPLPYVESSSAERDEPDEPLPEVDPELVDEPPWFWLELLQPPPPLPLLLLPWPCRPDEKPVMASTTRASTAVSLSVLPRESIRSL
ncbi:hypothetical protein ADL01_01720 [Streptomyces sp. NRRL WC-3618]|nr:hypothetical protein ADL01_01720 [Streptomyces sp. NRRL WC-3618]